MKPTRRRGILLGAVLMLALSGSACSQGGGDSGAPSDDAPALPALAAPCNEMRDAIAYHGAERVFRHQLDELLGALSGEPDDDQRTSGVLAVRDFWSLCGLALPVSARETVAAAGEERRSLEADALRAILKDQGIRLLDGASSNAVDSFGRVTCDDAQRMQPLSTADIVGIAERMADQLGTTDVEETGKLFFLLVGVYCPDLDMSGGTMG